MERRMRLVSQSQNLLAIVELVVPKRQTLWELERALDQCQR